MSGVCDGSGDREVAMLARDRGGPIGRGRDGASPGAGPNVVLLHPFYPSSVLNISDEAKKYIRIGGRFVQKVRCQR